MSYYTGDTDLNAYNRVQNAAVEATAYEAGVRPSSVSMFNVVLGVGVLAAMVMIVVHIGKGS